MKKIQLNKEDVIYAVKTFDYKKDAAKYLKCSREVFNNALKEYDIEFIHKPSAKDKSHIKDYLFITEQWMIDNWVNTSKSMKTLSNEYNVPESVIDSRRAKYNLKKSYSHPLNLNKFFNLSDPHIWYVAGLVATDGYLTKDKNSIEISLCGESERSLLQSILDYYEVKDELKSYLKDSKDSRLRIATPGLNDFFESNFNIKSGAKTFNVGAPQNFYDESCAKAYIRGCLDGDGTISKHGHAFSILTASEKLLQGIAETLNTYVDNRYHVRYERNYPIISGGGKTARLALDWVYSLENCFKLERKFNRYNQVNDIV